MIPTKTMLAIPCMDTVPVGFMQSILYLDKPPGTSACFNANSLVYDSRNLLSLQAIESGFDRVLWLDSDMTFKPDTLTRLSATMDKLECHMVTGVYVKRRPPFTPVLYSELSEPHRLPNGSLSSSITPYTDYPQSQPFTAAGCGFGCVMTSVRLLKRIWDKFGPAFNPLPWCGEDIAFCHRVNLLGEEVWCDPSVQCGHIGTYIYTPGRSENEE